MQEAKRRGAKLVAIDPYRSQTAGEVPLAPCALPGHRRGARARHDARASSARGCSTATTSRAHTLGFEQLRREAAEYPPERVARRSRASPPRRSCGLAREYATMRPAVIRVNYGLQRHAGGGMAVRTIACLPALVGAWRDPAAAWCVLARARYPFDDTTLERPDLIRARPAHDQHDALGEALAATPGPPVRALYVYNSNPAAVAPGLEQGDRRLCARGPVHGRARAVPDRHRRLRRHRAAGDDAARALSTCTPPTGTCTCMANNPAIAPLGEAKPNTEVFRLLAARWASTEACFDDSDEDMCAAGARVAGSRMRGHRMGRAQGAAGWQRLNGAGRLRAVRRGRLPDAVGQVRVLQRHGAGEHRARSAARLHAAARERHGRAPELAEKYPLALISPPARQSPQFLVRAVLPSRSLEAKAPALDIHPTCAARHSEGDRCASSTTAGRSGEGRVFDRARPASWSALSVWWKKLRPDGRERTR